MVNRQKFVHHDAQVTNGTCPICKRSMQLIYRVAGKPEMGFKLPQHTATDPGAGNCTGSGGGEFSGL